VGDVFTSTVRPLQDVAFTCFYILSGLRGWWAITTTNSGVTLDMDGSEVLLPVERNWFLHTVILPGCMVSPLWWRYCQNLRQIYESKKRWPYLGNAAKYFIAAQVALAGVYVPNAKGSPIWIAMFVIATLYQIWWDIFMDWGLLDKSDITGNFIWSYQLRAKRLYKSKSVYIGICIINILLRFCWTLNFIPSRYLASNGMLIDTFSADFQCFVNPALASAEILRRSLWGLLRLEWEVVKTGKERGCMVVKEVELEEKINGKQKDKGYDDNIQSVLDDQENMVPMSIGTSSRGTASQSLVSNAFAFRGDMSMASNIAVLMELTLYATIFSILGLIFATYRQVM